MLTYVTSPRKTIVKCCSTPNTSTLKLTFEQKYHCSHDYCLCTHTPSLFTTSLSVFPSNHPLPPAFHSFPLPQFSLSAPEAWRSESRCEVSLGVLVRVGSSGLTLLSLSPTNEMPLWLDFKHSSSVQESHRSSTTGKYSYTAESRPRISITVHYKVKLVYC